MEKRFTYRYRRCRQRGFTMRLIISTDSDGVDLDALRQQIVKALAQHWSPG
jgi:hypothetical protein